MPPPSGTVTFLFTDIEGSTRLWESAPEAMRLALERHDSLTRSTVDAHGGYVFATGGDGFCVAFGRAGDALSAAVGLQEALADETWPEPADIRVRMGLHTGEASERDGDYFGPAVNRVGRLMATAHGGQVVCSQSTASVVGDGFALQGLGEHRLRDLAAAEPVFQVGEGVFPPLRSVDVVPTNLPTVRTELIGRSAEVDALSEVARRERLVTFTGTGGVGKTRLALAVAASVSSEFPDGCWLVELAPVADGAEVAPAVAAAMRAPSVAPSIGDHERRRLAIRGNYSLRCAGSASGTRPGPAAGARGAGGGRGARPGCRRRGGALRARRETTTTVVSPPEEPEADMQADLTLTGIDPQTGELDVRLRLVPPIRDGSRAGSSPGDSGFW
jgi:class 3 adenylate cyclase